MGEPVSLFRDRLRIDPSVAPLPDPRVFGSADALAEAGDAALRSGAPDLYSRVPRFSFRTYGSATSALSLRDGLALPDVLSSGPRESGLAAASRIVSDPAFDRPLVAAARGGVEISQTALERPDGLSATLTMRADVAAAADGTSLASTIAAARPMLAEATSLESIARDLFAREERLLAMLNGPEMRTLQAALRGGLSEDNIGRVADAAAPLLDRLREVIDFLNDSQTFLGRVDTLLTQARAFESTYTARAGVRGALEIDYSFRQRVLHFSEQGTTVDVTLGATIGGVTPLSNPIDTSSVPGLRPLRTAMVTMQAIATVHFHGLEELAGSLRNLSTLAHDAQSLASSVRRAPAALIDPERSRAAQAQLEELQERARTISNSVNTAVDGVSASVDVGMRTIEATGPGGGVRELGASVAITRGNFDVNVAVTLRNLVGYLPGHYTDYTLTTQPDGSPGLSVTSEADGNVFSLFYPRSVAVDGSVRWRATAEVSFEVRGGLRQAVDSSRSGAAYASFMNHLGAFYWGVGIVAPLNGATDPALSATIGVRTPHIDLGLSGGANTAVFTNPNLLSTGLFNLNLTVPF